ncbi:MAG: EAL domain-containing protein, partial [Treponema sp.]|nr:EAL domain-containing protein [Treponema sp.]
GKLGPAQFIPIAEEDGHIAKIGRIITEKVIRQIAEWRKHGVPLRRVSINYSFGQLEDKEYVSYLTNLMKSYNIPAELIGIEITESLFMGNKARALEVFEEFKEADIKVALDDFGTGYSSLSYLTQLPLETVKIDKSLVDTYLLQNNADKDSSQFIKNIVSLVHTLGMKITVEGVEYRWQFDKLKEFGCDYIQGYFFSKPLSGGEIETFIPQKL